MPAAVDDAPLSGDGDLPDFRRRTPGRATLAFVGSAAVLILAGVIGKRFASDREQPSVSVAAPAPERVPDRTPAPESPQPAPPPAAPVSAVASSPTPTVEASAETSPEKPANTVAVTVKVVPEEAVIFRAGKRLGTGVVEVNVEPNVKQRFTALLDGYTPSNFTVDGTRDSITIMLKRAQKPRAAAAREGDSPSGVEPTDDSKASPAPAASAAPAPEGTTPAAAERGVSSAESVPE